MEKVAACSGAFGMVRGMELVGFDDFLERCGSDSVIVYATRVSHVSRVVPGESRKMAQKVLVQLVDDLDGTSSDDVSTVHFGLDGVEFEVDLSAPNAENLRKGLEEYIAVARRTGGRKRRSAGAGSGSGSQGEAGVIREWALENGYELSGRGRIPAHVKEAYQAAKGAESKPSARKSSRKK